MKDADCVSFLQWALPRMRMRWRGFRKVRRQVCKRIDRRLRELDLADALAYRAYLEEHPAEWSVVDKFCRITISRFYRDRGVFDYLRDTVLPELARTTVLRDERALRCWSVGCASGEEVYTLKILWEQSIRPRFADLPLEIIATDADEQMLDRARRGVYSKSSLKDLPPPWLEIGFTQREELYCVEPRFREAVEFLHQDVRKVLPRGPFHLILCRHLVFTYFDETLQRETLRRMLEQLQTGGIFVTGKQEPILEMPQQLVECQPNMGVYRKDEAR